jgi:hypothetical protein
VSYLVASIALVLVIWVGIGIYRTIKWRRSISNLGLGEVRLWLERLIQVREPQAYLIFEEMTAPQRFVQFRREVGPAGATLTCHFPIAPWSTTYIPGLRQVLDAKNISYSEISTRSDEPVTGFLSIENLDASSGTHLVDLIFHVVFECASVNVRLWGYGVRGDVPSSDLRHGVE